MRRFPKRPSLTEATVKKLESETLAIISNADPKLEAERRYKNARQAKWFSPVVKALKGMTGPGQRCMFCSGSESSDIEHFQPKGVFPTLAMTWQNYLWSCTPCNRGKADRFPPETEPGDRLIDPTTEDVWDFFFIDEFGFLTPLYDCVLATPNPRSVGTRDMLALNREAVQESRAIRLADLRTQVKEVLQLHRLGQLDRNAVIVRIDQWREQPFQPDVADYFLNGPGRKEKPFDALFKVVWE